MSLTSVRSAPVRAKTARVVIAALTYHRLDDLCAVVPQLKEQAAAASDQVEILVVDNDPEAGARDCVAGFGPGVRYLHAPDPGIAAARNMALDAASDADVVVFIDDDERPSPGWLDRMLATWRTTTAAAVVGPVISEFASEPDAWITAGRFFERRRLATGSTTAVAATNNLLLDLGVIRRLGLRFDLCFGTTGGSDTLFTRQLHAAGGQLVWCDEAVVTDVVPSERLNRRWVLRRAYRSGNSWSLTSLVLAHGLFQQLAVRVRLVLMGLIRVAVGGLAAALGTPLSIARLDARGRRTFARGAGMLAGAVGRRYEEYRRTI